MEQKTLNLLKRAYVVLADIHNQWQGRFTQQGQLLLCELRNTIAQETNREAEDIQDTLAWEVKNELIELANQHADDCRETPLGEQIEECGEIDA